MHSKVTTVEEAEHLADTSPHWTDDPIIDEWTTEEL